MFVGNYWKIHVDANTCQFAFFVKFSQGGHVNETSAAQRATRLTAGLGSKTEGDQWYGDISSRFGACPT